MRVVGGKYRSRVLAEFNGDEIRPTADKVKESLFNILGDSVENAVCLDLFAGTGSVGIEMLSRGAKSVVFTDVRKESLAVVNKNLNSLSLSAEVLHISAIDYLKKVDKKFDLIFIDPPYKTGLGIEALKVIKERGLLTKDGVAVFESENPFGDNSLGLFKYDERKYGRTYITFFKNKKSSCVFAGTFDPITKGHEKIIERARNEFEKVFVTIMVNPDKQPFFPLEDRFSFIKELYLDDSAITVCYHEGLAVEFLQKVNTPYYVRGIRNETDLIYEKNNENLSKTIYPDLITIYYKADKEDCKLSSTSIREKIESGEDYKKFLPKKIADRIIQSAKLIKNDDK
ncbi:MAG: 16S rRNA (guanine(966)-N(2))-methyltransferase RsmD [Clostridia bacterium]|nr:16S rRNA (guanine(966)-N(2))-methyltransferase RsmD [Clostridia bacterium]